MTHKQLDEIFRALAQDRRLYGGHVCLSGENEIPEGLRLMKIEAESVIETLKELGDTQLSKVTYISLQNDTEVLVAWFFTEEITQ